ncbi:putative alpha-aminoadipic semialdehyde synthase, mitochondrial isoform X2 [Apostichopus japonicus]|uniref:Putative alpha-aminoadipic semialdehyde synthase, mitochondrial isoform X2 n=1 Tax=Stichopus japonicus TaxID=307972 RepID=A0A2G8KBW7_STIJA|nr:putative alpha-aminoadipic semialdehyde synthase, mitochondrial isoform X2 [Apostichopus japonicus]
MHRTRTGNNEQGEHKEIDVRGLVEKGWRGERKKPTGEEERFSGDGVLVCSVDNMPAQLPREATDHFGEQFTPLIPELIKSDASRPLGEENFSMTVKDVGNNRFQWQLTSKYEYIAELREKKDSLDLPVSFDQSGRKVFILGSGNMAAPTVEYLTRDRSTYVTVGSEINSEIEALSSKYPNTMGVYLKLTAWSSHPLVAKLCIKHKKHMVTASYVSPEMKALQQDAFDAGITIMNEVGLDPGIDHLLAMECFDAIKEREAKDSTKYYLPTESHSSHRGQRDHQGFSAAARTFHEIGMIDNTPHPALSDQAPELTWRELLCLLNDKNIDCPQDELNEVIFNKVGQDEARFIGIKE